MTAPRRELDIYDDLIALEDKVTRLERALRTHGAPLDVRRLDGNSEAYQTAVTSLAASVTTIYRDAAKTQPLALTYTPPMDAWWEVTINVGAVDKLAEATDQNRIGYIYGKLTPNPASGSTVSMTGHTHSNLSRYHGYLWQKTYPLQAGVAYTVVTELNSSGGNWNYWQGINHMWIEGRAYPRA